MHIKNIHTELEIENVSGNIGGLVRYVLSPSHTSTLISETNSIQNWVGGKHNSNYLGGVASEVIGRNISNIKTNFSLNTTSDIETVAPLIARSNSNIISTSFSLGDISFNKAIVAGGLVGRLIGSSLTNSFGLLNITGIESSVAGKVIGLYQGTENTTINLKASKQSIFNIADLADDDNNGFHTDIE